MHTLEVKENEMKKITNYAKNKINKIGLCHIEDNTFAAACYNDNSISDLLDCISGPADYNDMIIWKITAKQWRDQIWRALAALVNENGQA